MTEPSREIALWLFLDELRTYLRSTREPQKAFALSLRRTCDHFKVKEACVAAVLNPDSPRAEIVSAIPRGATWDLELLATFLKQQRADFPSNLIVAPIQRRGRLWAVLTLRGAGFKHPFDHLALRRIAKLISESIELMDWRRTMEVRAQIDRKILEQLRPQDLFYQVLHGLRSLTQYDHSSALLISDPNKDEIELVAEQVAWRKGKSNRIGLRLPLNDELRRELQKDWVFGFDRQSDGWKQWSGEQSNALAELLDYNTGGSIPSDTRESAMLCAPFSTRDGILGVLKVAARHRGMFATYEAGLVRRFVPLAAVAIQNLQRNVTLESKWVEAERKHVAANLLSGVSHDVNNALGSVLPLVQEMLIDVHSDAVRTNTLAEDLEQIERSIQTCCRIFGGLLALAKDANQSGVQGNLRRALDSTFAILKDRLDRQRIRLELQLGDVVPNIQVGQADLERVFLNLATNAGDAMPNGGLLSIKAENLDNSLAILITDTGVGITPENLARIQEPFFTTKHNGTGLGLSVCRTILRNAGGHLYICSEPGSTQVRVLLPIIADKAAHPE